jgi:general secretion pathway protein C
MAVNVVLGAALVYVAVLCAIDITEFVKSTNKPIAHATHPAAAAATGPRTRPYYDAIVKRDIFNLVPQQVAAPPPVVSEDLHLKLLGTSLATKSKPYAIIGDDNGVNQKIYQLGDQIPSAGTLVTVENTRVIIDHDGHRVALEMPKLDLPDLTNSGLDAEPAPAPAPPPRPAVPRSPVRRRPPFGVPGRFGAKGANLDLREEGPGRFEASRAEVMQTLANPSPLLSQIRAEPHMANGQTDGLSISSVAPNSVFDQLGLHAGDMITAIDGKPFTNPLQGLQLLQSIQTLPSVDLTVNRNGSPVQLHLDLQ